MDLNTKLEDAFDDVYIVNALKRANITTVEELLFYSFKDLYSVGSIGKKRIGKIKKWAWENNLKFDHELTAIELEERNEERRKNIDANNKVYDIFGSKFSYYLEKLGIHTIEDLLSIEDLGKFVKYSHVKLRNETDGYYLLINEKYIKKQLAKKGLQFYNLEKNKLRKTKKIATFNNIHIKNEILEIISDIRNEERLCTEEIMLFFFNALKILFDYRKQYSEEIFFSLIYTNPDKSFVEFPQDSDHSIFLSKLKYSYFSLVDESNEIKTIFMDHLFEGKLWEEKLFSLDDLIDLLSELDVYYELTNNGIIKIYPKRKLSVYNSKEKVMII